MFERNSHHLFPEDDDPASSVEPQVEPGTFRPARLSDIVGQTQLTERLTTHVGFAVSNGQQPGHVLLDGPSGYGKSSVASTLSQELCAVGLPSRFREIMADAIPDTRRLALEISQLRDGDVFFLDEIHLLRRSVAYALFKGLEDRVIIVPGGSKEVAQTVRVPAITVVGATTHSGQMLDALRNRFKFKGHMEPYAIDDLSRVLAGYCERAGVDITPEATVAIARASRYTPRLAIEHIGAVRAYAWAATDDPHTKIDAETAVQGLEYAECDPYGLNSRDHRVLRMLAKDFRGGPIGLKPLATALGMEQSELSNDVLPFLIQAGLWRQTGRGQCATKATYRVQDIPIPALLNGLL